MNSNQNFGCNAKVLQTKHQNTITTFYLFSSLVASKKDFRHFVEVVFIDGKQLVAFSNGLLGRIRQNVFLQKGFCLENGESRRAKAYLHARERIVASALTNIRCDGIVALLSVPNTYLRAVSLR